MARKRKGIRRKRRTREHVLADRAVNHIERQVLFCDWSLEEITRDYGIDLIVFTYNSEGDADEGHILMQAKGAEKVKRTGDGQFVLFRVERADLLRWLAEPMPLILIVYEAGSDTAWWLYIQQYFRALPGFNRFRLRETITVRIPHSQTLDVAAVREFGRFRDHVLTRLPEDLHP